jgi:malonate-semialdehyde dehydrogenase (acetylating) / methylmalonate-semialdehyde dehydrogenase
MAMEQIRVVPNYIRGDFRASTSSRLADVLNPATAEILARVPFSAAADVDAAAAAAHDAFPAWRGTPAVDRVQYLFTLKTLLHEEFEDLARTITMECGKTLGESRAELQRAIENVEVAAGIPTLMQGTFSEDIARGIDEIMIRQPVGPGACISPFNFPAMIPFWFFPYAIACGNTYVIKPSERVPLTMEKVFRLVHRLGLPPGVLNMVQGGKETVEAILDHPRIRAISFVGSTPVARAIYARSAVHGKRVQAQGGAKNPIVVLPDADMEMATRIVADSAFGCAGQRCLAASLAITVGEARRMFAGAISEAAAARTTGNGLDPSVEMGPVISAASRERIEGIIQGASREGGAVRVDGRKASIPGHEKGFFVRPTVIDNVPLSGDVFRTEIFGPVLGLMHAESVDDAVAIINSGTHGNMACLFTGSGAAARTFRNSVDCGNVGINVGVAAPMAFFPFSGWRESFFGDLHAQGHHAVEFFTQTKVVVERWPSEWSRTF